METNDICGIYKIQNKINGKIYIGQSTNIKIRWKDHKSCGRNKGNRESHKPLYQAIYKYGLENFDFSIIEECSQKELNEKEIYWIKYYDCMVPNGYNLIPGGDAPIIYDYQEILDLWNDGFLCWEIEEIIGCNDTVVHKALLTNGITQDEIFSRKLLSKKKPIVALSIKGKTPLKKFDSVCDAERFFNNYKLNKRIDRAVKDNLKAYGYYWEYINENNLPKQELTDEDFLSYQEKTYSRTEENKKEISLRMRKVERPSREELKLLIRTKSFLQIGKDYKVSDNAIRKWCDFYNLPRHKRKIEKISDEDWKLV